MILTFIDEWKGPGARERSGLFLLKELEMEKVIRRKIASTPILFSLFLAAMLAAVSGFDVIVTRGRLALIGFFFFDVFGAIFLFSAIWLFVVFLVNAGRSAV